MNLYLATSELKTYIGLTGAGQRGKLHMLNEIATDMVNGIIGTSDCCLHKVVGEQHYPAAIVNLSDTHVVEISKIMDDGIEYTQTGPYDILCNRVKLNRPTFTPPRDYYVEDLAPRSLTFDYVAGWATSGWVKITISDWENIASDTRISFGNKGTAGFTMTRNIEWLPGTDAKTEAENIANWIADNNVGGCGLRAFSSANNVYIMEDAIGVEGRTITVDDTVRLAISSSTLKNKNFPAGIKGAVVMWVSSQLALSKNPRMKSFTIGSKTVNFSSEAEFQEFRNLLKPYMPAGVFAI